MRKIRIGSRESRLAVVQAEIVMQAIKDYDPSIEMELVTMTTTGDQILDRTLSEVGGKGLFVKELDTALREGRVDITVHSAKDVPMDVDENLPLVAFSRREDCRDVLVLPEGAAEIDRNKPIGCASSRRQLQLRLLFPGVEIIPIRGNIQTRLAKLDTGEYSALVLAAAGLERLGLKDRISQYFTTSEILPAACQGILAVQARKDEDVSYLAAFDDAEGRDCAMAERAFVRRLDGGCSAPTAAYAEVIENEIIIWGLHENARGLAVYDSIFGDREQGEQLAITLAERFLDDSRRK